jgi:hypothetical protein
MMPAATNMGSGQCMGTPDTLYDSVTFSSTGVMVPIPGPNTAMHTPGMPTALKVIVGTGQALVMSTMIATTISPGVIPMLGMISQVSGMQAMFTKGSTKVLLTGQPAICLTCTTTQNMANAASGIQCVPSQPKVLFAP